MRIAISIDGRHAAFLSEEDAKYSLAKMDRVCKLSTQDRSLKCVISKNTAKRLIEELQWLLTDPNDDDYKGDYYLK